MTPEDVRDYVAGRNDLVHASYMYGCHTCKYAEIIYLGVGVEGPDKSDRRWIASPFVGRDCPKCHGSLSHIAWHLDQHFREPIRPPVGAMYFRVPYEGPDPQLLGSSVFAGELVGAT